MIDPAIPEPDDTRATFELSAPRITSLIREQTLVLSMAKLQELLKINAINKSAYIKLAILLKQYNGRVNIKEVAAELSLDGVQIRLADIRKALAELEQSEVLESPHTVQLSLFWS